MLISFNIKASLCVCRSAGCWVKGEWKEGDYSGCCLDSGRVEQTGFIFCYWSAGNDLSLCFSCLEAYEHGIIVVLHQDTDSRRVCWMFIKFIWGMEFLWYAGSEYRHNTYLYGWCEQLWMVSEVVRVESEKEYLLKCHNEAKSQYPKISWINIKYITKTKFVYLDFAVLSLRHLPQGLYAGLCPGSSTLAPNFAPNVGYNIPSFNLCLSHLLTASHFSHGPLCFRKVFFKHLTSCQIVYFLFTSVTVQRCSDILFAASFSNCLIGPLITLLEQNRFLYIADNYANYQMHTSWTGDILQAVTSDCAVKRVCWIWLWTVTRANLTEKVSEIKDKNAKMFFYEAHCTYTFYMKCGLLFCRLRFNMQK